MASPTVVENSTKTSIESWFIPVDILIIICDVSSVILAILFLIIIIRDRTCRTVPMMLVGNSCFATLMFGSAMVNLTSLTLEKDLIQIYSHDLFCIFAGYLIHVTCAAQNYSFLLQAIYRYLLILHPTRFFWHSFRIQILFICMSWIIAFIFPMEYLFTGQIVYDVNNQVCELLPRLSFSVIYMAFCLFGIPVSMIMFIYFILVRYVKKMNTHVTPINTLVRALRELKMIRRTVILITIVVTVCFPYQLFLLMSFFNRKPKYNFRIAYVFGDISILCVIITVFIFTDRLKASVKNIITRPTSIITSAVT
ncbi:unnamed protein product [Adineta steineri]|uniref:G-protein coupled receptors family 1 profile domain-containing protein n=1 Tax=Adineta steineri TaxID=433720 RepID=A0A819ADG6_9BILA|nr:unnamed protein product [Adineta steineri]CAF1493053.1 unnamed protein product [Adineta steineri]CAF3786001.1 unnamed protein product [Adineta steineri]CAF4081019.1 unnamed protein product [Adineta steineri]